MYQFGPFEVNAASGELVKNGKHVKLQEQPFRLLVVLLENAGEVVSHEKLQGRIWPEHTFVDFDGSLRVAVRKLRDALGDDAESPRYIETIPKRGYRFLDSAVRPAEAISPPPSPPAEATVAPPAEATVSQARTRSSRWVLSATLSSIVPLALLALLVAGTAVWVLRHRHRKVLTERDTIVLADFANSTSDPVFDGALRQGLSVQLEQSPFLSIISEGHIQQTLKMMGQPANARLSPAIARELCQRTGSTAVLDGSIAQVGTQYLLTLKAVNCSSGDTLASSEAEASDKDHVLDALGKTAAEMRNKLGESLSTVQQFGTPLEQATTQSLEALQAYSLGRRAMAGSDWAAAVPFFEQAIQLDPNFAMAYARAGMSYRNLGEMKLGAEKSRRAYELRDRTSELERFYIESHYYIVTVDNLEKAVQVLQIWAQSYPRDWVPRIDLCDVDNVLGEHERALPEALATVSLNPTGEGYANLVHTYLSLNRLNEAASAAEEAQTKKCDSPGLRDNLYQLGFLQNDATAMAQQAAWAREKPGIESTLLHLEANTAAYHGKLEQARTLSEEAVSSARRAGETEVAAVYEAAAALREAQFGHSAEARNRARDALGLSNGDRVQFRATLALALAGDTPRAETLANNLESRFPGDTIVQGYYLPTIRAQLALHRNDPSRAIEVLQTALPYELSSRGALYPVYVRAQSYLDAHRGAEAVAEFQKILNHSGIVINDPVAALAHLQLGRAYALAGDTTKACSAYQDFFSLWKDADPDVPVLIQARAEYAKLE